MKINNSSFYKYAQLQPKQDKHDNSTTKRAEINELQSYPAVYFCGGKAAIRTTVEEGKNKLLKKLLKMEGPIVPSEKTEEKTKEEIIADKLNDCLNFEKRKCEKIRKIRENINNIRNNALMNATDKRIELIKCRKMYDKIINFKYSDYVAQKKQPTDINIVNSEFDVDLIATLKESVLSNDFDLVKVFKNYYSKIKTHKKITEFCQTYPQIKLPPRPEEVVAKKLEKQLDKSFYDSIMDAVLSNDTKTLDEHFSQTVKNKINQSLRSPKDNECEFIYGKIAPILKDIVKQKCLEINKTGSYASVQGVKNKSGLITEQDKKLLSIDYDKFVLSVMEDLYHNLKRPNDVIYQEGSTSISLKELADTDYKVEKVSNKIKGLFIDGETLKNTQRDYDRYNTEELKERLQEVEKHIDNDELYNLAVSFEKCKFLEEDNKNLKLFFREIDKFIDRTKSQEEIVDYATKHNISPNGTIAEQKLLQEKEEQAKRALEKEAARLAHLQGTFDREIHHLYSNGLYEIADFCESYKPKSLEPEELSRFEKIMSIIGKYKSPEKGTFTNTERMLSEIKSIEKYNISKKFLANEPLLKKAEAYAKTEDGTIDEEKAGNYLINHDLVREYKPSNKKDDQKNALDIIMASYGNNTEGAVECLCRYDEYKCLSSDKRDKLGFITKYISPDNKQDQKLLEYIMVNDYINTPTTYIQKRDNQLIKFVIEPKAKKELIKDGYGKIVLPAVGDFIEFEEALKEFSTSVGGIKNVGKNNKKAKGIYELKIDCESRIIGAKTKNGYVFDTYLPKGVHDKYGINFVNNYSKTKK